MDHTNDSGRRASGQTEASNPTLASNPHNPNSAAYLAYPVKHVVSSLYRRMTEPPEQPVARLLDAPDVSHQSGVYTPPRRTASPFQPPPLTPLTLKSLHKRKSHILTRSLAEEIRLLVPPRLQLVDSWRLAYSLETDGASLATLYKCCGDMSTRSQRAGYVIVVRDSSNGLGSFFGAYLTDPPKPSPHFFGTGECFLWRASILPSMRDLRVFQGDNKAPPSEDLLELAGLPPPPSADTTNLQRVTTVRGEKSQKAEPAKNDLLEAPVDSKSGTSTPDRIRFKAFPYSGMNDFMIFCETGFLSVGGGDGHYGLWLDDTLEKGISDTCLTFGNEPLSEEGHNFSVLDLEIWYIGA
jgi:hypothetical protein